MSRVAHARLRSGVSAELAGAPLSGGEPCPAGLEGGSPGADAAVLGFADFVLQRIRRVAGPPLQPAPGPPEDDADPRHLPGQPEAEEGEAAGEIPGHEQPLSRGMLAGAGAEPKPASMVELRVPIQVGWSASMAIWTALLLLLAGLVTFLVGGAAAPPFISGAAEIAAVIGAFALICAAEAAN